jgi:hypothetical protein
MSDTRKRACLTWWDIGGEQAVGHDLA